MVKYNYQRYLIYFCAEKSSMVYKPRGNNNSIILCYWSYRIQNIIFIHLKKNILEQIHEKAGDELQNHILQRMAQD